MKKYLLNIVNSSLYTKTNNFITKDLRIWWYRIDIALFISILSIIVFGVILVSTASPYVAERVGLTKYFFLRKHLMFLMIALPTMLFFSLLDSREIKRISIISILVLIILLVLVLFSDGQIKGAKRWINLLGFNIQPSEFVKPFIIVITAWFLSKKIATKDFPAYKIILLLYLVIISLIILQPDIGMTINISLSIAILFFLAGISILTVIILGIIAFLGAITAYFSFSHVRHRIDSFLFPDSIENYQVNKSLEAFANGNFFGKGLIEGVAKKHLPDSHSDFIFAVAGEEFGLLITLMIVFLFAFFILRTLILSKNIDNIFHKLTVIGLISQFAIQTLINMSVSLNLFPTKGMTLPFISYGGSSLIAMAISVGIILSFTKRTYGKIQNDSVVIL